MKSIMPGSLFVAIVTLTAMTRPADATTDPLHLEVKVTGDSRQQMVNIRCVFLPTQSTLIDVDELNIYGSKPHSKKESFQNLASVDKWNKDPQLFGSLATSSAGITGSLGFGKEKSELNLSYNLTSRPHGVNPTFKCAVRGTDRSREPVTLSETTTVLADSLDKAADSQNLDAILDEIRKALVSITNRLTALEERVNKENDKAEYSTIQLEQKMLDLDRKVEENLQSCDKDLRSIRVDFSDLNDSVVELNNKHERLRSFVKILSAEDDFKLSRFVRDNTTYMVRREKVHFNMSIANSRCVSHGGYLAEINDSDELEFVANFLRQYGHARYVIGASDTKQKGNFTYIHSGDIVPSGLWGKHQPKINRNKVDCVEIDVFKKRLSAIPCDAHRVKYVCELPLEH